jgi:hypothetical protein
MTRSFTPVVVVMFVLLAPVMTSCASDKSAEEHRALAAVEEVKASEHRARYDENARAVALATTPDGHASIAQYNPTHWQREEAEAHSRAAERHRAAARALEESEDAACVGVPAVSRAACPLLFPNLVEDIDGGVRVTFAADSDAERAAAMIRCQQAFAIARAFEDLPSCALYARNLHITQHGAIVELRSSDDDGIARLRDNIRGHHANRN